jgi:hypothetical protein
LNPRLGLAAAPPPVGFDPRRSFHPFRAEKEKYPACLCLGMKIRRWTPFVFAFPDRYATRDSFWQEFDIERWSRDAYEWTGDPWNGYRDFAKRPAETVAAGRGDCEDYALVAASWALARGAPRVGLGFCWEWPYPWPRHVVAYDHERVYSSGHIAEGTVAEWLADSRYQYCLKRSIVG